MISALYNGIIARPFYNGLVFLIKTLPFFDAGVIVVIFTVIIKLILLPLSIKASRAQLQMRGIEKDLNAIKEKYKDNKEEQSRKTIDYYKEKGINPFASFLILIIQLPIIIGLYQVFRKSGLPIINSALLYPFVSAPHIVNMIFLGFINIADKSLLLAVIAGVSAYFQFSIATPPSEGQGDMAKAMAVQMKYFFPILVVFISYSISASVALYWITSNIFAILQELYIRKKYHKAVLVE